MIRMISTALSPPYTAKLKMSSGLTPQYVHAAATATARPTGREIFEPMLNPAIMTMTTRMGEAAMSTCTLHVLYDRQISVSCRFQDRPHVLVDHLGGQGDGHVQSLIIGSSLLMIGFQILVLGFLGDVISFNRRLIEETLYRLKKIELDKLPSDREKQ